MKRNLFLIAVAALAFAGCQENFNPDVPLVDRVVTYAGEGAMVRGTGNDGINGTYSWKAEEKAITIDLNLSAAEVDGWEYGHFELPTSSINEFIADAAGLESYSVADTDESTFVAYNPDGSKVGFSSYKPGMWLMFDGTGVYGDVCWQWNIWAAKGEYYDPGYEDYKARFFVVVNPGADFSSKIGTTTTSKAAIIVGSTTIDFTVNYHFSE